MRGIAVVVLVSITSISVPSAVAQLARAPAEDKKVSCLRADNEQQAATQTNVPRQPEYRYKLQPGDSFNIRFPFTPEFNQQEVTVQPDGRITLLEIGETVAAGKTLADLRSD